ncbi:hypothetical protein [Streptomyces sp. NPDC051909]
MTTLLALARAARHLWQCSGCGTWSDTPTTNGKCASCHSYCGAWRPK